MTGTELAYRYGTPSRVRHDAGSTKLPLAWDPRIDVSRLSREAGLDALVARAA